MTNVPNASDLIFLDGMLRITRHERTWVLFENAQAGMGAEVNLFAMMVSAGIFGGVFDFPSAGGSIFWQ